MGDELISRKMVLEKLKVFSDRKNGNEHFLFGIETAIEIIENEPVAFAKERVIEDLNDWMKDAEKWATKYDEVGDTDNMDLQDMAMRCYKNAIEIAEKGGIE